MASWFLTWAPWWMVGAVYRYGRLGVIKARGCEDTDRTVEKVWSLREMSELMVLSEEFSERSLSHRPEWHRERTRSKDWARGTHIGVRKRRGQQKRPSSSQWSRRKSKSVRYPRRQVEETLLRRRECVKCTERSSKMNTKNGHWTRRDGGYWWCWHRSRCGNESLRRVGSIETRCGEEWKERGTEYEKLL